MNKKYKGHKILQYNVIEKSNKYYNNKLKRP
jgi:hypothetical protein